MDFFESQEVARRHTGRLVALFVAAVLALIVATWAIVATALAMSSTGPEIYGDPGLIAAVALGTLLVVGLGTAWKLNELRGGGAAVAQQLGGRLLTHDGADARGRRLLNVVEEMALASGMAVPPVYLLADEPGINAFAAGWGPEDAVVGVTAGALEHFDRAELQGVIAHEFSHILNGDMRLNLRLMGVLHGILVLGLIGRQVLAGAGRTRTVRRSSSRGGGGGAGAAILVIALGLVVVGAAGFFFGNLIKAAVSRQREFLADASAVQFTRDPNGIAGALRRIGALGRSGSRLRHERAAEASHMYFGNGVGASLFATHPPLEERIRRIDPAWDGRWPEPSAASPAEKPGAAAAAPSRAGAGLASAALIDAEALRRSVGQPRAEDLAAAGAVLHGLPPALLAAAREPREARFLLWALLAEGASARAILDERVAPADAVATFALRRQLVELDDAQRLPLVELVIPSLRALSPSQHRQAFAVADALVAADAQLDEFEWMLLSVLRRHVPPPGAPVVAPRVRWHALGPLVEPISVLLSFLAQAGARGRGEGARAAAFEAGARKLGLSAVRPVDADAARCDAALGTLVEAAPLLRRNLLEACVATVLADRSVTVREAELLRAVADRLQCPVPPLRPGAVRAA